MKYYIENRVITEAMYIIKHNSTVWATAKALYVSKSMVHHDLTKRLPQISPSLYQQASAILETNKAERAYRGGMATKRKYLLIRKNK